MSAKSYFRFVSVLTITINIAVGVGALYLIERILPAIEEILDENAYSVSSVLKMQDHLAQTPVDSAPISGEKIFWQAFDQANSNITIEGEKDIIAEIRELATEYWAGDRSGLPKLSRKLTSLANLNLETMHRKNKAAKTISLAGAWALGFLIIFALLVQLSLKRKILDSLIVPTTSLFSVITEYASGNQQRRFSSSLETAPEIKHTGDVLNKLLDENLTFKLEKS